MQKCFRNFTEILLVIYIVFLLRNFWTIINIENILLFLILILLYMYNLPIFLWIVLSKLICLCFSKITWDKFIIIFAILRHVVHCLESILLVLSLKWLNFRNWCLLHWFFKKCRTELLRCRMLVVLRLILCQRRLIISIKVGIAKRLRLRIHQLFYNIYYEFKLS